MPTNREKPPILSVIMAVHNSTATVERALRSLLAQTFADWEVVVVDDGSTDKTDEILQAWAARDGRIRVVRLADNRGSSAARNEGLRLASGEFIAYLDDDDEFYPDYLARVAALRGKADVLVFGFDMAYEDGPRGDRPESWDPMQMGRDFFSFNPAVPLGMSHGRSLLDRAGRFNEMVWLQEDFDLWKRMARVGAKFTFVSAKSGVYHIRQSTLTHTPRLTAPQREAVLTNWRAGRPIFASSSNGVDSGDPPTPRRRKLQKIAFVSPQCLIDFNSDAARATLDGLQLLASAGFECQAFCGAHFNAPEEILPQEILARQRIRYEVRNAQVGPCGARMIFALGGKVPLTLFSPFSTRGAWRDDAEAAAFLTACEIFLNKQRPDVVWTSGYDPVSLEVQRLVMRLDIPIVLALDDAVYADDSAFQRIDYAMVSSEYARQFHWKNIGLACQRLPLVIDPPRVSVEGFPHANPLPKGEGSFVTFVNPEPRKGVHVFARIAEVLAQRRPDIPLLLVEGAARTNVLGQLGVDLGGLKNVKIMPNTPDPGSVPLIVKS